MKMYTQFTFILIMSFFLFALASIYVRSSDYPFVDNQSRGCWWKRAGEKKEVCKKKCIEIGHWRWLNWVGAHQEHIGIEKNLIIYIIHTKQLYRV